MFLFYFVPDQEAGHDRRIRLKRKLGNCRRGRCGNPEEIREYPFASRSVLIEKNPDRFVASQSLQNIARCASTLNRNIPAGCAVTRNERFDSRIINRPHHKLERISIDRMRERTQLPGSEMRGHENHAAPAPQALEIVLEPIMNNQL